MKVGIVGAGFMGTTHAEAWSYTDAVIQGFVSEPLDDARHHAEQYKAKAYPTLDELLTDVDIVDICVPTYLHHEMVIKSARAGKDILCEKPMARTVEEAQEMVRICQEANVKLMAAHVVRFAPEYSRVKSIIENGDIGEPAIIRLSRCTYRPRKILDNWYVDYEKSGGMMFDLMIHDFDYARWIAGEVTCVFAKSIGNQQSIRDMDYGLVILKHENGVISHLEGAWAYPPPYFRTHIEISGTSGWVEIDSDKTTPINTHISRETTGISEIPARRRSLSESIYTTQIKAFYSALVHGTNIPITGKDGLAAVQIASAALESAQSGLPITLEKLPEVIG
jgi:predicted dehydrogenase